MKWEKFYSKDYIQYVSHHNPLFSKVMDYLKMDENQLQHLEQMMFYNFDLLEESDEVYTRIMEAIENHEKICVYGDYDCDGILATSILVKAFNMIGKEVGYHIPHRFEDGYGLNVDRVNQIASKGYSLIITVDNGIKAFDAIDKATELGIDVIVTDHHALSNDLPNAYAFLHPKLSPSYPFKEISGGMVAYKLTTKLLNRHDPYLFCLAAITTISDMMPLVSENRAIVKKALSIMNKKQFPALSLLLGSNKAYTTSTIGFTIVPKINSFGRLPELINPNICVKYFVTGDQYTKNNQTFLHDFANKAVEINKKRQNLTNELYATLQKDIPVEAPFVFLYEKPIHEGIIGLLASRFTKERNQVSFVMNYDEKNNVYKGSARAIPGFHLNRFLEEASDDLLFFGGHELAAGFTLKYDRIPSFENKIKQAILNQEYVEQCNPCLVIEASDLTIENIVSLKVLEPFGQGNEEPIFCIEHVTIQKVIPLSDTKHMRLQCVKDNTEWNALYFNCPYEFKEGNIYDIFGTLSINEFQGIKSIQMNLKCIE